MVPVRSRLEWYPPSGEPPIVFTTGPDAAYRMFDLLGVGPIAGEPVRIKSPGQVGMAMVDSIVPERVVIVAAGVQARTRGELWTRRASLARALVSPPVRRGARLPLGRLRLVRHERASLELEARPLSSDIPQLRSQATIAPADIEWVCPYPYWTAIADSHARFQADGGFEWPLEFPLEMPSHNVQQEISNAGDVDAPILARIYGDVTTARLLNVTTDETLEVTGAIAAGDYIEVTTGFGDKRVELVSGATRTSVMDRVNLAKAEFWSLRPGINVIRFEADINVSGRVDLYWRERFGGV